MGLGTARNVPGSCALRVSPKLLIFEILAFLVFAILAGAGFLAWKLSQGPLDLSLIKPQIERSMSDARGGQPVEIDRVVLEWVRDRNRPGLNVPWAK